VEYQFFVILFNSGVPYIDLQLATVIFNVADVEPTTGISYTRMAAIQASCPNAASH
jgi:hypothetical protein